MTKPKKLIVDAHDLLVAKTGIRTYIFNIITALQSEQDPPLEVLVYPDPQQLVQNNFFRKGGPIRSGAYHIYTLFWKHILVPYICFKQKADILLVPDYYAPIWKMPSVKKVVVFHDSLFWDRPEQYGRWWLRYFRWAILAGLRGQSVVVCVSKNTAKKVERVVGGRSTITSIYTPFIASEGHGHTASGTISTVAGLPYCLHVGVFEKRKNLTTIVRAFRLLLQDPIYENYRLVLVGDRSTKSGLDDYEQVLKVIASERLEDRVILPGHVSPGDLQLLYDRAKCLLFPSREEGFGLPIIEAFSHNLPVIVSQTPALVEIGAEAVLVARTDDPKDWCTKMKRVLIDDGLKHELVAMGTKRLQLFSPQTFRRSFNELLEA
ncbi:MAG: glycosyltransferase family 1 protein [Bacteroidota bacterium]